MAAAQGRSLVPVMTGQEDNWRKALLVEEDQPFGTDGLPGPVRLRTVVTNEFRLTQIEDLGITELYDLMADPEELVNLAGAGTSLEAEALRVMVQELMRVDDDSVVPFDAA